MANNNDLKIVFGAMTLGDPNTLGARVHDMGEATKIVDCFQQHGHKEVDTARLYGKGSSERMLAELDYKKRGLIMDTKLYPNAGSLLSFNPEETYSHKPEDVRRGLLDSLHALHADNIDMFYLHGPDRKTDFEATLREVNNLHQEGYFTRFGISNYMSWEVAAMCEMCKKNGWIMPSVYQGIYHLLQRTIEGELLPCLRKYNIALYVFQPLAGGFLTGKFTRDQTEFEPGSRFDPSGFQGKLHQGRYWNDTYFDALEVVEGAAKKHDLAIGEVALRWLKHHSELKQELGDAIIVGASSVKHLEENLVDLEKMELSGDVVEAVEKAWLVVKGVAPKYWH